MNNKGPNTDPCGNPLSIYYNTLSAVSQPLFDPASALPWAFNLSNI